MEDDVTLMANQWVQATPGCAGLLFLIQWPGAPEQSRSAEP